MHKRVAERKLKELARKFPVVAVTDPRQSVKTPLVQAVFPKHAYVSLEDLDGLKQFQKISSVPPSDCQLIYNGKPFQTPHGWALHWSELF